MIKARNLYLLSKEKENIKSRLFKMEQENEFIEPVKMTIYKTNEERFNNCHSEPAKVLSAQNFAFEEPNMITDLINQVVCKVTTSVVSAVYLMLFVINLYVTWILKLNNYLFVE